MQKNLDQSCLMAAEDFVFSLRLLVPRSNASGLVIERGAAAQRSDLSGFSLQE